MLLSASQSIATTDRHWELSRRAAACQAEALRRLKASYLATKKSPTAQMLMKDMAKEDDPSFRALPSACAQHSLGRAAHDYYNYVKALVAFKRDRTQFRGKPRAPHYTRVYGQVFITNTQFRVEEGRIVFAPILKLPPIPYPACIPATARPMGITLTPTRSGMNLTVSYETEPCSPAQRRKREKAWAKRNQCRQSDDSAGQRLVVDLNLQGVAVLNDTAGSLSASVINLKPLLNRIEWGHNVVATYQSRGYKHDRRRALAHRGKLNRHTTHYLHCVANELIHQAKASGAKYLLVGQNKRWKQKVRLGRQTNRRFCCLPFAGLITLLRYKCRMASIWLQLTEESYTSKVDHLALEPMQHRKAYKGSRVHRGLFRSSTGRSLHADVNGCIGIGRKLSGNRWITSVVQPLARKGARLAPKGTAMPAGLLARSQREVKLAA